MEDVRRMQVGQLVDLCISYNERQEDSQKRSKLEEKRGKRRKANQNDINSFLG